MKKVFNRLAVALIGLILVVFPFMKGFSSWMSENNPQVNEVSANISAPYEQKYVCYIGSTYYPTIEGALSKASSGNIVYVIPDLGFEVHIKKDCTIINNVTLTLPYEGTSYNNSNYSSISNGDFVDASNDNNRKTLVIIDEGVTLTNQGTLNIGGTWGSSSASALSHVSGPYAEIKMSKNSKIISSGTINCYGYIKEYNSSLEEQLAGNGSMVSISGPFTTPFVVYDFVSAGSARTLISNHVFPFAQFDIPNIQSTLRINSSATLTLKIRVVVQGQTDEESIVLVGSSSSALIRLTSGYIDLKYTSKVFNRTSSSLSTNAASSSVSLNGNATINYISLSLGGIATIDTRTEIFPFTYRFHLAINSGTLTQSYPVKFMNGSSLTINQGATMSVGNKLLFYPASFTDNRSSRPYPTGHPTAYLTCNGTLNVTSSGYIGGLINTTNYGSQGTLNFSSVAAGNLACEMIDGSAGDINIMEHAHGMVIDSSNPNDTATDETFVAGGNYTSSNQVWSGAKLVSSKVNITVRNLGTTNVLIKYSVLQADNASGSNSTELVKDKAEATEVSVESGKYFKIVMSLGDTANLLSSTSGYSGPILDTWILCNGTFDVELVPLEKVTLTLGYSGTGVNHTGIAFTVYYAKTPSISNTSAYIYNGMQDVQNSGSGDYAFPKGYYFKVVYNNKWTSGETATYTVPTGGLYSGDSSKHVNTNIYCATGTFNIKAKQDYSVCVTGDSLLMVKDKGYVAMKDVSANDEILSFNHFTGEYEYSQILTIVNHGVSPQNVLTLTFSNGTEQKIVGEHGFFDKATNRYERISLNNYNDYIGHEFVSTNGLIKLVSGSNNVIETSAWAIFCEGGNSPVINDMMSVTSVLTMTYNWFEFDSDLRYKEEAMNNDIATYGLYTYDEWANYVSESFFNGMKFCYFKVAVGKGLCTYEDLLFWYGEYLPNNGDIYTWGPNQR